jgi:hypothetical protein
VCLYCGVKEEQLAQKARTTTCLYSKGIDLSLGLTGTETESAGDSATFVDRPTRDIKIGEAGQGILP